MNLAAGWHPLTIEFFQAAGPSQLHVRLGRQGREPRELSSEQLRARLPKNPTSTTNTLNLSLDAIKAATNRLARSFGSVARVSGELTAITNEVPHPELIRLAEHKTTLGPGIRSNLDRLPEWSGLDANLTAAHGDELVSAAGEANRLVHDQLQRLQNRWRGAPELQAFRLPLDQLQFTVREMRPMAWENRNRQDLLARRAAEFAAATVWTEELRRQTAALGEELFRRAQSRRLGLAARAAALKASLRLEREATPAGEQIQKELQTAPTASELLANLEKEMEKIENVLADLARASEAEQRSELATLARAGLEAMQAEDQELVSATAQAIATAQRRQGQFQPAQELEQAAVQPAGKALRARLRDLAQRDREPPVNLSHLVPPPLHDGVETLEQTPTARVATAEHLARPRLALALEAERLRRESAPKVAVAYSQLGRDLGRLLRQPEQLTAEGLRPLAERASALAGLKGSQASEAELRAAAERAASQSSREANAEPAESLAARLDEVAGEANEAAGNQGKRPELMRDLDELAAPSPDPESEQAIASKAASEAKTGIEAAPGQGEAYREASRTLADGASELRLAQAGKEAARAAREPGNEPTAKDQAAAAGAAPPKPNPASVPPRAGDFARPVGTAAGLNEAVNGPAQAEWARLREKLRESVRRGGLEHFSEEQQETIRAYFKRLAADR